jgi:tetratricopeptide (TPR) repeat protein
MAIRTTMNPFRVCLAASFLLLGLAFSQAGPFDEMALDRWAKLREVERYQLNIAEKYYREQQWKVAADEYEKFLKLYERSEGAPFAQLKWSHCQIQLRKQNTAIKDGYQSVIDYYPESPEAVSAAYLIGKTYKDVGDLKAAKKAYAKVLTAYPKTLVAVHTRLDLVAIAGQENDTGRRVTLLKELTYDVERKGDAAVPCVQASHQLAQHFFTAGDFGEGLKALETSHKEDAIPANLMHPNVGRLPWIITELTAEKDEAIKKRGLKVADEAIGYLRVQVKSDLGDEKRKPRAVQCWYYIADVQQSAHRPDKQREVYEEMLAKLGTEDKLLGHVAQWYKTAGKRDLARATYLKYKDPAEGQRQVAVSWVEENKFDEAIAIYRGLALQDQKGAPQWLSQAALVYRRAAKADQAITIYRELLIADAKNADGYHWEIAQTLYTAQRWREALTAYRGTDRFPTNYQQMAMCNRQLKQYDEAITLYQQIMAGHAPTASWALLQIAYTQEQAGRAEPAIKSFKQVCDRYPKTTEGSTAHEHLNRVYKISVTLGGAKD